MEKSENGSLGIPSQSMKAKPLSIVVVWKIIGVVAKCVIMSINKWKIYVSSQIPFPNHHRILHSTSWYSIKRRLFNGVVMAWRRGVIVSIFKLNGVGGNPIVAYIWRGNWRHHPVLNLVMKSVKAWKWSIVKSAARIIYQWRRGGGSSAAAAGVARRGGVSWKISVMTAVIIIIDGNGIINRIVTA